MGRELQQPKYKCSCCGREYNQYKTHFYASASVSNKQTGYLPVCKTCVQKIYSDYALEYENEYKAIRRVCMMFDIYFSRQVFDSTEKRNADTNRMAAYMGNYNRAQYNTVGKTYDNTIIEEKEQDLLENSKAFYDIETKTDEFENIDISALKKKWGIGYEPDEYLALENHYNMLSSKIDDNDVVQQQLIMDLCDTKIQEIRCRKHDDKKGIKEFKKLYQETLGTADLKPKDNSTPIDTDQTIVMDAAFIEKYTPADVYKNTDLFKDFDNLEDYLERFVERPRQNLINNTNIMDNEFCVKDGDNNATT